MNKDIQQLKINMSKMQQNFKSYDDLVKEVFEKVKHKVLQRVESGGISSRSSGKKT
ncbi:MAG: hypothetical protein WBZ36_04390 [Candidatus Nitrosopolaris sp.]